MKTSFNNLDKHNKFRILHSEKKRSYRILKLSIKLFLFCLLIGTTVSCGLLKLLRSSGSYQVAVMRPEGKSSVAIGKIASRDARFAPYLIDNFKDMLQLQLIDEGYVLKEIPNEKRNRRLSTPPTDNPSTVEKNAGNADFQKTQPEENSSNLRELLPENLRNVLEKGAVVGFSDPQKNLSEDDFLSADEIKIISETHKIQFYVQGAVGNNDSGTLLEEDSNSLVFLKIYDSSGTLKGGIAYTVNGRSLTEANLLKDVCQKISGKLSEVIKSK